MLFGDVSPSGKLPYTIYPEAWAERTPMEDMALTAGDGRTYKWYKGPVPAPFLFGAGISYTTFRIAVRSISGSGGVHAGMRDAPARASDAGAESGGRECCGNATVTAAGLRYEVTVTNVGGVAASDAVLVFSRPARIAADAPRPLPNRQLFDFGRTPVLAPGESHALAFIVRPEALALVDYSGAQRAYAGTYEVLFSNGGAEATRTVRMEATVLLSEIPAPPPRGQWLAGQKG